MKTVIHNGHRIDVSYTFWGKEKIFYDGKEVFNKFSVSGSTHVFKVTEHGREVEYEVAFKVDVWGSWCEVRCDGEMIYTDR